MKNNIIDIDQIRNMHTQIDRCVTALVATELYYRISSYIFCSIYESNLQINNLIEAQAIYEERSSERSSL